MQILECLCGEELVAPTADAMPDIARAHMRAHRDRGETPTDFAKEEA